MSFPEPALLALDFDGVLCDGRPEYFATTCLAYRELWPEIGCGAHLDAFRDPFFAWRPAVAHGWEMPLLLHGLVTGVLADTEPVSTHTWGAHRPALLAESHATPADLGGLVDEVRDTWIERDLPDWLGHHNFYPGIVPHLQTWLAQGSPQLAILTTKAGRFIQQLLEAADVDFPPTWIWGREAARPKVSLLAELGAQGHAPLWFVEDYRPTLDHVAQTPGLETVGLFLATWGYNTPADRADLGTIHPLTLNHWNLDFRDWWASAASPASAPAPPSHCRGH